ncbi:hypothetical protein BGZ73_005568 [Actinomortierella ambigua]|nr:hypothetical protein BGZ73_005568 [Actinomortierella ambigua]
MTFENSNKVDLDAPPSYDATIAGAPQSNTPTATPSAPLAPHTTGPPPPVPPPKVPGSPQTVPSTSLYSYTPKVPLAPQSTGSTSTSSSSPSGAWTSTVQPLSTTVSPASTQGSTMAYQAYPYQPQYQPQHHLPPPPTSVTMAAIAFSQENRIRLVNVPQTILPSLRAAILQGWGRPVKVERPYHGGYELELNGQPWDDLFGEKYVRSRRLLTHLIGAMIVHGWHLTRSFNTTRKSDGKDTLFFELAATGPDEHVHLVPVVFRSENKVVVVDAPPTLLAAMRHCLQTAWPKGIQAEKDPEGGGHEFKLVGSPFDPITGETSMQNRMMIMALMNCWLPHGYKLYATFNVGDHRELMETWLFRRMGPHWQ